MKKIILSLSTTIFSIAFGFSQNLTVIAPPFNNATSQLRAPNGTNTQVGLKACYIVMPSELANLTAGVISSVGFSFTAGTGSTPVVGNFTLYLENTPSTTYAKSTSWPTVISSMTQAYAGTYTVAGGAGTAQITLPTNFNFTIGGGLYVAFEWSSTGPFSVGPATYAANNALGIGGALSDTPTLPTPDQMTTNNFRPCFTFKGVNTVTNEISVMGVEAPGKLSNLLNNTQAPVAYIKNHSTVAKSNITVSLTVAGANTFTDTQTISSLASGAVGTVTFNTFSSSVLGTNNMSVSVDPDQVTSNNLAKWTQTVTCTDASFSPPVPATSFSTNGYGFGPGAGAGGIFAFYYNPATAGSVTAVRLSVFSSTINIGKKVYAVVLDNNANIVATGNTLTLGANNFNTFLTLPFATPVDLTPATDWYIGFQTEQPAYPMAILDSPIPISSFYVGSAGGGSLNQLNVGYLGLEGVFKSPNIILTASSSTPVVCLGQPVTLTASGVGTYTWSANTGTTGSAPASIMVTPTATGSITYIVTGTDGATGCKTNSTSVTQSVTICTIADVGIASNSRELSEVKIFPNPAVNGKSVITGLSGLSTITVFNLLGEVVLTQQTDKENFALDFSNQPNGTYLVKIGSSGNNAKVVKIINQN